LGLGGVSQQPAQPQAQPMSNNAVLDIFGTQPTAPATSVTPAASLKSYTCYSKNDLVINLTPQPRSPGSPVVDIIATFINNGFGPVTDFLFQVAVPKSLKLTLQPASGNVIQPGSQETQSLRIENPNKVL
jgi:AP-1 complex subunit gamma-1